MRTDTRQDLLVRAMPAVFVVIWSTGFIVARIMGGWQVTDTNVDDGDLGTDFLLLIERVQFTDQLLLLG